MLIQMIANITPGITKHLNKVCEDFEYNLELIVEEQSLAFTCLLKTSSVKVLCTNKSYKRYDSTPGNSGEVLPA